MSEEKKTQRFSIDTPDGLIRTLGVVRLLIDGTENRVIATVPMSRTNDSFQEALNWAQIACPKLDWVREARVSWLMLGMDAWDEELDKLEKTGVSTVGSHSPYSPNPDNKSLMDHQTFEHFLTVGYIGVDCNAVMDKYLALLKKVAERTGNQYWGAAMVQLIKRRTCCERPDDPHRDPSAYDMFLRKYGLYENGYFVGE
ncbi:MAG: hypothetical protein PHC53_05590 [Patescibacteria group bacterium]|nr:hypothetical protein [Patescibacteria group bacterium]